MNKKQILSIAILSIMLAQLTLAQYEVPGLYSVADWELDVCDKWGGLARPVHHVVAQGVEIVSVNTVVSLLGQRTPIHLPRETIQLYKFNWYVEPNRNMHITITAAGPRAERLIVETDARASTPLNSLFTLYSNDVYTNLTLDYGGAKLTIPIVEVE